MKILIVSMYFWPENFKINDFALGLKQRGVEVTVLTGVPNYPSGKFFAGYHFFSKNDHFNGIKIKRVPILPRGKGGGLRLILNYLSFIISASILSPFYCRDRYDLIFVFASSPITVMLPAIFLKKIKKVPVVLWILDLWPESLVATNAVKSSLVLNWVDKLVRFIYRQTDLILVSSEGFIPSVSLRGVTLEKIKFFPNWAESIYRPVSKQEAKIPLEMSHFPEGFRVFFAGNMGVAQDFPNILAAFEQLKDYKDIHLFILGDGRMRDWVKDQIIIRGLQAQVHLLGAFPMETMPDFFSLADAMLVTLKADPLFSITLPGRLQSYMACGKPIIAVLGSDGNKLVHTAGAGMYVDQGDPQKLSEAILEMYQIGPVSREAMGIKARKYYENNFDRDTLLDKFIQLTASISLSQREDCYA